MGLAELTIAKSHLAGKLAQNGKATKIHEANILVHKLKGQTSLISNSHQLFMQKERLLGERSPAVILENYSTNGYTVVLAIKKGFTQAHFTYFKCILQREINVVSEVTISKD